jgi:hypothetical protein
VHIIYYEATIMFFGPQGLEIISHTRPSKGTRYVGNGKRYGITAGPAGASGKRTARHHQANPQRNRETATAHKVLRHGTSSQSSFSTGVATHGGNSLPHRVSPSRRTVQCIGSGRNCSRD